MLLKYCGGFPSCPVESKPLVNDFSGACVKCRQVARGKLINEMILNFRYITYSTSVITGLSPIGKRGATACANDRRFELLP